MIVIYTPKVTNRIKYTLDLVFTEHFGLNYEIITNPVRAVSGEHIYISYSPEKPANFFSIYYSTLLIEDAVIPQKLFVSRESDFPVFFQTTETYDIGFDLFSCIFYLISRYEEYLPHDKDSHGRYMSSNSILANPVFNFSPIVDIWLNYLQRQLQQQFPQLQFRQHNFEYQPTFDIDHAFKYRGRNWLKHPPNIFSNECRNTLFQRQIDLYDTFEFIQTELTNHQQKALFFFLMNDSGKHNSNVSPSSVLFKEKIQRIQNSNHYIGIHPSFFALEENRIQQEKMLLENITHSSILFARQHFLRITFPDYFTALLQAGIQHDYSLLYPDTPGFRAGYSRPFSFYNLLKDEPTTLILHPVCWMDATYEYYKKENIEEIQQKILLLVEQLIKINAKLVTLFHNDLLGMDKYRGIFSFFNRHTNLRG